MALSNIFNEPRREITETLVGAVVVLVPLAAFLYLDYQAAVWFEAAISSAPNQDGFLVFLGMCAGVGVSGLGWIALQGIHAAGDRVCNALDRRGARLRPTMRRR